MIKLYVEGHCGDHSIRDMFSEIFDGKIENVYAKEANIIVFSGGEDVSPELYNEPDGGMCFCNKGRDDHCVKVYNIGIANNAKFVGICRGAQFLAAMLGGKLWQHIYGHNNHITNTGLQINSLHHQGIKPVPNTETIHTCLANGAFNGDGSEENFVKLVESFKNENHFAVQWHPEFIYPHKAECVKWFMSQIRKFAI